MAQVETQTIDASTTRQSQVRSTGRVYRPLKIHSLVGLFAFLLLSLVEWVDSSQRIGPLFQSIGEWASFSAYFSVSLLVGVLVGGLVGLGAWIGSLLVGGIRHFLTMRVRARFAVPVAWLVACGVGAIALNQVSAINRYVIGLIREAEKIASIRAMLLSHERSTSYLVLAGLLLAISLMGLAARIAGSNGWFRWLWLACMGTLLGISYYLDSRVSLQLYEYTFHRSLFLVEVATSMALIAALVSYFRRSGTPHRSKQRWKPLLTITSISLLVLCLGFTFVYFDSNQNLKTLVFYRTTLLKQNFKLARWAADIDRDGYSAVLGGGDADDLNSLIHPAQLESIDDQIDNNCIGGDLTSSSLEQWRFEHQATASTVGKSSQRFNVVFVFIDTLRADHMSAYGYHRMTSPKIDRLATRGFLFENAFTPSPRTSEAVQKFMQSTYWDAHLESWTQVLSRNGYDTMLFPGRRSWTRYKEWMPVVARSQGRPLKENIDVVIETLQELPPDKPFCAFVYVPDPHKPYVTHQEYFYGDTVIDQYDGEISYTDAHVGRLLDWIEEAGRLDDTMIVIMSDHGESLGERDVYLHSTQLYNEQMRVPIILFVPGHSPRRVSDYVTTVDLGTTILDAVGLSYQELRAGVSLMPSIRNEPMTHPPVYGEQTGQEISPFVRLDQQVHPETKKYMVITQDAYKLVYNRDPQTFELFDLRSDPGEGRNVFDHDIGRANRMRQLLGRFVDIVTASRPWDADEGRYSRAGVDGDKVED